ncbi:acetylcholinesterase, partial [Columba livia]
MVSDVVVRDMVVSDRVVIHTMVRDMVVIHAMVRDMVVSDRVVILTMVRDMVVILIIVSDMVRYGGDTHNSERYGGERYGGDHYGAAINETELLRCLRAKSPPELVEQEAAVLPQQGVFRFAFVPVVDGDFLEDTPEALLAAGGHPDAEVLLGAVQDEGTYFLVYGVPGFGKDNESLISPVVLQYTDWSDQDNPVKNREALDDIVGDHNVVCPLMQFARRWAERGGTVFAYLFEHRASNLLWPPWMGVPHGYEIEFVFGRPLNPALNYTAEEEEL